jgi:hypothetical protein
MFFPEEMPNNSALPIKDLTATAQDFAASAHGRPIAALWTGPARQGG